jgi:hypothetical protein
LTLIENPINADQSFHRLATKSGVVPPHSKGRGGRAPQKPFVGFVPFVVNACLNLRSPASRRTKSAAQTFRMRRRAERLLCARTI